MSFCLDLFIKDRYSGRIHRIGEDRHDSMYVDNEGTVHYYNLQNGDGCPGYKSAEAKTNKEAYPETDWGDRADEYVYGYEFVTCPKECQYCQIDPCVEEKVRETKEEKIVRLFYGMSEKMQKNILEIMELTQENKDEEGTDRAKEEPMDEEKT